MTCLDPCTECCLVVEDVKQEAGVHVIEALGPLLVSYLPQHKYISIADVQIKNEEALEKCPMSLVSQGSCTGRKSICSPVTEHACLLLGSYCVPGKARPLLSWYVKVGEKR